MKGERRGNGIEGSGEGISHSISCPSTKLTLRGGGFEKVINCYSIVGLVYNGHP